MLEGNQGRIRRCDLEGGGGRRVIRGREMCRVLQTYLE